MSLIFQSWFEFLYKICSFSIHVAFEQTSEIVDQMEVSQDALDTYPILANKKEGFKYFRKNFVEFWQVY